MTKKLSEIKHVTRDLPGGGFVLVLGTGAVIDAQAEAMLQALHSRSTGGIRAHLEVLSERGAEKFMEQFYVGYGHKSIGDCGSATVFVEGVSMLAAKAIQDWRLYSGQEASTRYIDFSQQPFIDPVGSDDSRKIHDNWREFYMGLQEPVQAHLRAQFARGDGEDEKVYQKAIAARAFDITRGFLPAGASTNVAWRMNLRQFADELMVLRHHPLEEVRQIAQTAEEALSEAFTQSFGHKHYEATENYNQQVMQGEYYYHPETQPDFALVYDGLNYELLREYEDILRNRPPKTDLPQFVADTGTLHFEFLLDFGSWRDIQRHRAVVQRMPLVSMRYGFGQWYLDALPEDLRKKASQFLQEQQERIETLDISPEIAQYYTAMGYRVACRVVGDIRALVYLAELRATRFVHPTLVHRAVQILDTLEEKCGNYGLVLHRDNEPNRFDVRRGEHDIVSI